MSPTTFIYYDSYIHNIKVCKQFNVFIVSIMLSMKIYCPVSKKHTRQYYFDYDSIENKTNLEHQMIIKNYEQNIIFNQKKIYTCAHMCVWFEWEKFFFNFVFRGLPTFLQ